LLIHPPRKARANRLNDRERAMAENDKPEDSGEKPVILEERAVVEDLPRLDLPELVVKTQFYQQEIRLRHDLELEKLQALHSQEEERANNSALREQEKRRQRVEIGKDIAITAFFIVVVSIILIYTGQRIGDPNSSIEEKKIAYGIWGIALGAIVGYLAGRRSQSGSK
jgi:hypothetical protein